MVPYAGRWNIALTSIENSTPPIGEPNATATPAALAAVTISRIFPESVSGHKFAKTEGTWYTLAVRRPTEKSGHETPNATRDVYGRSFLANR